MSTLTFDDLDRMQDDERWLGFGFPGARENAATYDVMEVPQLSVELLRDVDEAVLASANAAGLDYEQLFAWANSKSGRWFGDVVYGGGSISEASRFGLLPGQCGRVAS